MVKKILIIHLMLVAYVILCGAKIYKWTDENGQTHYGTRPPQEMLPQVEEMNVSSGGVSKQTIEDIAGKRWFANDNNQVIEFQMGTNNYVWITYQSSGQKLTERGTWQLFPGKVKLVPSTDPTPRQWVVRNQKKSQVTLVNAETERQIEFRTLDRDRKELSEKENLLSGDWDEVNSSDMLIGKAQFDSKGFRRYKISRGDRAYKRANPNYKLAEGNWSVRGDTIVLDYAQATKKFLQKTATTESWEIENLDLRTLILRNQETGRTMRFKRKRTK